MDIKTLGIDLAKNIFHVHACDAKGRKLYSKKLKREQLASYISNLPICLIGMEACGGAHYWGRKFRNMGHTVKLMSPQFVKPYVKSNKNDWNDAEAIAEAVTRPTMRFVPIKQVGHQDIQSLHRARSQFQKYKISLSNHIRGILQEYGIVIPVGNKYLKDRMSLILEDADNELTMIMREEINSSYEEWKKLEQKVTMYDKQLAKIANENEACKRLLKVEGVGPLSATMLYASISEPLLFKNGRECGAWLGLVPKQHSSGGKDRLLGISKRGDTYLRSLLINGGRSSLNAWKKKPNLTTRCVWALSKDKTIGHNKTCVAIANKIARTAWALLAKGEDYETSRVIK